MVKIVFRHCKSPLSFYFLMLLAHKTFYILFLQWHLREIQKFYCSNLIYSASLKTYVFPLQKGVWTFRGFPLTTPSCRRLWPTISNLRTISRKSCVRLINIEQMQILVWQNKTIVSFQQTFKDDYSDYEQSSLPIQQHYLTGYLLKLIYKDVLPLLLQQLVAHHIQPRQQPVVQYRKLLADIFVQHQQP